LWRLAESRRGSTAERAVPAEDIHPSERNRLEAVLEGLDEGDSRGKADRR
jgi:hypothetical protein